MSRTYKDRPPKIHKPWECNWDLKDCRGAIPKRRREIDTEYHWMTTPSWWVRLMMNRPQRRASKCWEQTVCGKSVEDLEYEDPPVIDKKPHIYYW